MHDSPWTNEGWLGWHLRIWRSAREHLTAAWDCPPVVILAAYSVSAVRRLADRPTCSVVGRVLRSVAGRAAMRHMTGGDHSGSGVAEEAHVKLAGGSWWDSVGSWQPLTVVWAMWQEHWWRRYARPPRAAPSRGQFSVSSPFPVGVGWLSLDGAARYFNMARRSLGGPLRPPIAARARLGGYRVGSVMDLIAAATPLTWIARVCGGRCATDLGSQRSRRKNRPTRWCWRRHGAHQGEMALLRAVSQGTTPTDSAVRAWHGGAIAPDGSQ